MESENRSSRSTLVDFLERLMPYDVISLDIYDTAVFRKVDMPNDVFTIMAMETGHGDFVNVRKTAENVARERKEASEGTREVTLAEIYDVLVEDYGIDRGGMEQEIHLELALSTVNPYIFQLYTELVKKEKTIIFTSDMYLPQQTIEQILQRNGYADYERLYLSNSYKLHKGDGTIQRVILKDYAGKKIIHIGDSQIGDVEQSRMAGMDAVYHINARELVSKRETDNLGGSIYRAVINNSMYNGTWDKNRYYSHGFKTGGILVAGYCEYINQIAKAKKIDKILFCSRDCEVLHKIYNRYFKEYENEYIRISRYAVLSITFERNLYSWAERFIFRYVNKDCLDKTVGQILQEAGVSYLIELLDAAGIDKEQPAGQIKRGLLKRFIFSHADRIRANNEENVKAARQYYREVIGSAKNILVVDIGWSGTCITALKYFIDTQFPETSHVVTGTLLCTAKNRPLTTYMENGIISAYACSPFGNMDLLDSMMSGELSEEELDYRHLALEFLFTSVEGTVIRYKNMEDGSVGFEQSDIKPENAAEILAMQEGMIGFVEKYCEYRNVCNKKIAISPYVAFRPLLDAIQDRQYLNEIYRNFPHDSTWMPYKEDMCRETFGEHFGIDFDGGVNETG